MTKIEFLVVADHTQTADVYDLICQRARLARTNGGLYIHTRNEAESQTLDEHLWTASRSEFIPHSIAGTPVTADSTVGKIDSDVIISSNIEPDGSHCILINLGLTVPWFFSRFERFIELVRNGDDERKMGRERYLFYKRRGYPLRHRQL